MNATLKPDQIIYFGSANTPVVPCMYHEGYFIHNFCKREECGLPMCAECVKIHAEEHAENGWPNEFDLFSNCLTEQYNKQLEYLNLWAVDVQETFNLQDEVAQNQEVQRKKLQEVKAQIYHAIEDYFRQIENQITNETTQQTEELKKEIRAQHRIDFYDWKQQESILKKLNSQKCMPHLIKMYHGKKETPEYFYEQHHNEHLEFMQKIRHSLRQVIVQDRLPQILPLLKQSIYLASQAPQTTTYMSQNIQQTPPQQVQQQVQVQAAQSQIMQSPVNKYQARVVQPFSIMREQPVLQQVAYQPQPIIPFQPTVPIQPIVHLQPNVPMQPSVPLQPISFYPQYQEQALIESTPQPFYGQQSSPPQILNSQVRTQPIQMNNQPKITMAQRYYEEMNKNKNNYQ